MDFQGFQNQLPIFWVIIALLLFFALSFWSYKDQKHLSSPIRYLLTGFRTCSLGILLFLYLNPYFFSTETIEVQPKIMVLADNSESMAITKGSYNGERNYRDLIENLNFDEQEANFEFYSFSKEVQPNSDLSTLELNGTESNFIAAVTQIEEIQEDLDAVILLSDGIITFGQNPILRASALEIPIYSLAVGDTQSVKDISISNVLTNQTAYTNTSQELEIEVAQKGFSGFSTYLQIFNSENEVIGEQEVIFEADESQTSYQFTIEFENEGLRQYYAVIQPLDDEWSNENNQSNFSVEVLDSKINVLHIAFEIHPDVKMIRSILAQDQQIELTTLTWLGDRFIEDFDQDFNSIDLIFFHGLNEDPTKLFPQFDLANVPVVISFLPLSINFGSDPLLSLSSINFRRAQLFEINPGFASETISHPILELPELNFNRTPPLIGSLQSTVSDPDAEALYNVSFQGLTSEAPIITARERGNQRRVTIAAWNWFTYYQSNDSQTREFVSQLFTNIVNWTSKAPDDRLLKILTNKNIYSTGENIVFDANLINENGDVEESANIELSVKQDSSEFRNYLLSNRGDGFYRLELDGLSAGLYEYEAIARKNGRVIDDQRGEFVVDVSNAEYLNTIRNDAFLTSLSLESGGSFFSYENASTELWNTLEEDGLFDVRTEIVESYTYPVRHPFWFILVITLLVSEWLIRKKHSLP